jgi:adenylate cyclase
LLVVAIDDRSLEVAGRWPWPRDYHALLLQICNQYKPKALAFDMFFSEPDMADTNPDGLMAQHATTLGRVVFGAVARRQTKGPELHPRDPQSLLNVQGNIREVPGGDGAELPIAELRKAGRIGFINSKRDPDGEVRRIPLLSRIGDTLYPSLVLQTVCTALDVPAGNVEVVLGDYIRLKRGSSPSPRIPVDSHGQCLINFRMRPRDFVASQSAVNYLAILKSYGQAAEGQKQDWDLEQLRGRILIVGLTATGLDVAPTPIDDNTPLVLAQANAINTILRGDFVRRCPPWVDWLVLPVAFFGLARFNIQRGAFYSLLFSAAVLLLYLTLCWAALRYASVWVDLFWPVAGIILVVLVVTAYQFFTEEREKRVLKRAFEHYLSLKVMAEVLRDPNKLILGGVRRKITVLFSDIRGFTSYSEKRPPEEVVPVLNELQDELSRVIFRYDGTLDKYMGDAIMAFWGAPGEPKPDDALQAVRCAHELVATLTRLGRKWRERGIEPFGIGVGINSGEMIVGNMGSTVLFNYTVIGDEVNLGARLEALTRQFDTDVIMSDATFQQLRGQVDARDLGEVTVKGRARPVRIYALVGLKGSV